MSYQKILQNEAGRYPGCWLPSPIGLQRAGSDAPLSRAPCVSAFHAAHFVGSPAETLNTLPQPLIPAQRSHPLMSYMLAITGTEVRGHASAFIHVVCHMSANAIGVLSHCLACSLRPEFIEADIMNSGATTAIGETRNGHPKYPTHSSPFG